MPEWILELGIEIIRTLQSYQGPLLNGLFLFCAKLGDEVGYLIMIPLIWWLKDWKVGAHLFIVLIASTYINILIKDAVQLPRPFLASELVMQLSHPGGWSFPSGHSQMAMTFWGATALHFQHKWLGTFAVVIILLMGISRMYLGVHYPSDVLAGYLVGGLVILFFFKYRKSLAEIASNLNIKAKYFLSLFIPLILISIHPTHDVTSAMGSLAGCLFGLTCFYQRGKLEHSVATIQIKTIQITLSLAVLIAIYAIPKLIIPEVTEEEYGFLFAASYRIARYFLLGLWVSFGAPILMNKMNKGLIK